MRINSYIDLGVPAVFLRELGKISAPLPPALTVLTPHLSGRGRHSYKRAFLIKCGPNRRTVRTDAVTEWHAVRCHLAHDGRVLVRLVLVHSVVKAVSHCSPSDTLPTRDPERPKPYDRLYAIPSVGPTTCTSVLYGACRHVRPCLGHPQGQHGVSVSSTIAKKS